MKNLQNNFIEGIGNTPLIKLKAASEITGCNIYGKAEYLNPGGSVKDRAALALLKDAEEKNRKGTMSIEYLYVLLPILIATLIGIKVLGSATSETIKHNSDSLQKVALCCISYLRTRIETRSMGCKFYIYFRYSQFTLQ